MNDPVSEDAHELRLLLERAVPHLGAPAERIQQVRARVRRRRRRRAALTAGLTGAGAVAFLVSSLGPYGAEDSPGGPTPPASSARVPAPSTAARTPSPAPTVTPSSTTGAAVGFPGLGLTLWPPAGWYTATPAATEGKAVYPAVEFLAERPLGTSAPCPTAVSDVFACSPLSALAPDGVLIAFRETDRPHPPVTKATFTIEGPLSPDAGCRAMGGGQQLVGWGLPRSDGTRTVAVDAYVCLRKATDATHTTVRKILGSALLGANDADASPGAGVD